MAARSLLLFGTVAIAASDAPRWPTRPPLHLLSDPMLRLEKRLDQTFAAAVAALHNALPFGQAGLTDGHGHLPAYIGTWTKTGIVNADEFLDKAMGVPWMKRRAAITGKQTQRLTLLDDHIIRLAITDLRGTKTYDLIPDGKPHKGKGFMSLPVRCPSGLPAAASSSCFRHAAHKGHSRRRPAAAPHNQTCPPPAGGEFDLVARRRSGHGGAVQRPPGRPQPFEAV